MGNNVTRHILDGLLYRKKQVRARDERSCVKEEEEKDWKKEVFYINFTFIRSDDEEARRGFCLGKEKREGGLKGVSPPMPPPLCYSEVFACRRRSLDVDIYK
jgi:hypothetical protein